MIGRSHLFQCFSSDFTECLAKSKPEMFYHNKATGSACAGMTSLCIVLDFCDQGLLQRDQPRIRNQDSSKEKKPEPSHDQVHRGQVSPKPDLSPNGPTVFVKVPTENEDELVSFLPRWNEMKFCNQSRRNDWFVRLATILGLI